MADETQDTAPAGLADVITRVREELEEAQLRGEGSRIRFSVEKVNLEFAIQVKREGTGRAGLRIGVLTAEGGGSASRDTTHRIQIELQPHGEDGGRTDIGRN